jgi:hypothetical protein
MAENEGIEIPGEGSEGSSMSPSVVAAKVVEKAQSKGWKPLSEYSGDPADWVDAKEFLGREKLYGMIHDLKKQAKQTAAQTEADLRAMAQHYAKMSEVAYKKALSDLKAQRAVAIEDRDTDAVEKLDEQIEEIKTAQQTTPQPKTITPPETEDMIQWRAANPWFDNDPTLREDAVSIGVGYLASKQGRVSQAETLEYVTAKIKKMYPEKFTDKRATVTDSKVEGSGDVTRSAPAKGKKGLSVSDLSDEEKTVMRTFLKRGVLKDVAAKNKRSEQEEYLAQLADAKAR